MFDGAPTCTCSCIEWYAAEKQSGGDPGFDDEMILICDNSNFIIFSYKI